MIALHILMGFANLYILIGGQVKIMCKFTLFLP